MEMRCRIVRSHSVTTLLYTWLASETRGDFMLVSSALKMKPKTYRGRDIVWRKAEGLMTGDDVQKMAQYTIIRIVTILEAP
ncbi:hypothetical protein K504DRAFT_457301 [Pleomassaria siparia CBS 279.74]|uniref:Uncharacterized protein n=1 Tax=Pleomassaria siparia CBS 279.74 TaxID=1314801 RepID=A0A6G1KRW6_9PLEO|nr:hypothetical protein K504DRAFT_457301 [Pleomassaria siparia CBS 279.74]